MSGLAEPIGAIIGYTAIKFFVGDDSGIIPQNIMGILLGAVAGIMVYISLDELLPTSRAYGKGHDSIIGLVVGHVCNVFKFTANVIEIRRKNVS